MTNWGFFFVNLKQLIFLKSASETEHSCALSTCPNPSSVNHIRASYRKASQALE